MVNLSCIISLAHNKGSTNANCYDHHHYHHHHSHLLGEQNKTKNYMDHSTTERCSALGTELFKYNICISETWEITRRYESGQEYERWVGAGGVLERVCPLLRAFKLKNYFKIPVLAKQNPLLVEYGL